MRAVVSSTHHTLSMDQSKLYQPTVCHGHIKLKRLGRLDLKNVKKYLVLKLKKHLATRWDNHDDYLQLQVDLNILLVICCLG